MQKKYCLILMILGVISCFFSASIQAQTTIIREYKVKHLKTEVLASQFEEIQAKAIIAENNAKKQTPNLLSSWKTVPTSRGNVASFTLAGVQLIQQPEASRLLLVGNDEGNVAAAEQVLDALDIEQQIIILEVMLMEYFYDRGFNWSIDLNSGTTGNFSDVSYSPGAGDGLINLSFSTLNVLDPSFKLNIRSLVSDGRAKVLTNPHIAVKNGETAELRITEQRYVQLQTSSINGLSTQLQTIEAGVDLTMTPTISADSVVQIAIHGELSEFLPFSTTGEYQIERNRIKTNVSVKQGETFVMGGIIKEEFIDIDGGVPFLKDIPLIGALFKRLDQTTIYIEEVLYITPHIYGNIEYEELREKTPLESRIDEVILKDKGRFNLNNPLKKRHFKMGKKQKRKNAQTNNDNNTNEKE